MKHFTVYDPRTGRILRGGTCQDHMLNAQAKQGESVIECQFPEGAVRLDLGTFAVAEMHKEPEPSYQLRRAREYPSQGDQLDDLWKLIRALPLELTPEAYAMLDRIQMVKNNHPKDS